MSEKTFNELICYIYFHLQLNSARIVEKNRKNLGDDMEMSRSQKKSKTKIQGRQPFCLVKNEWVDSEFLLKNLFS